MDDQFGGRTDDDLFYDDFEPVESEAVPIEELPVDPVTEPAPVPATAAAPAPAQAPVAEQKRQPPPEPAPASRSSQSSSPSKSTPAPVAASSDKPAQQSKGLSTSRYADKSASKPTPAPAPAPATAPAPAQAPAPTQSQKSPDPPPNAPTAPKEKPQRAPASQNTAVNAEARLQSGANPRQKLTDDELAAKLEKMKLLSAEKARKFEMAEKDQKQHAQAYARGMEEARKRKVDEAERRKRGEEERRKLEDERAKNRERKLKAMNIKDGSWDEGKEAMAEEEARRGFRGANGGIRGTKSRGLGGSRFSREGDPPDVDRFLDDRYRGRGRGDRGRGGGRGGRGGGRGSFDAAANVSKAPKQEVPAVDDFPALPSEASTAKKADQNASTASKPTMAQAAAAATAAASPPPLPAPSGGKWDDEMEALDALNNDRS